MSTKGVAFLLKEIDFAIYNAMETYDMTRAEVAGSLEYAKTEFVLSSQLYPDSVENKVDLTEKEEKVYPESPEVEGENADTEDE